MVVPKALRTELGITGPTELEIVARDGSIELTVADLPARVETRNGEPVIVVDGPTKALTREDVRTAIDRVRRSGDGVARSSLPIPMAGPSTTR
jgi:bifunctional DNA-binding transcriptional regulator/antitoxin component of YhaV-PrlF toxin-antitoxin module